MPQNVMSGPWIGQRVLWTGDTPGVVLPATVYAVAEGLPSLSVINGATLTDQPSAQYDDTGNRPNSWRWPDIGSGI